MTFLNGILAFSGALTLILSKKSLNKILIILVSFATGAMIGGAFFHLIPEAIESLSVITTIILVTIGIIIFYLIENFLHWRHCHEGGKCKIHPVSYLVLYGDGIHNFIDGIIIAGAFLISIPFGIMTSILILLHELPQEIGDFGVLVYGGFTRTKALLYNFLSQLTSVLGGIIGFYFLATKTYSAYLLPIAAGGFIYIAMADLIPEILKETSLKKRLINAIAIVIGLLILLSAKFLIG